jgi:hypothetical protein
MKTIAIAIFILLWPTLATAQGPPADFISSATVARIITPANGTLFPLGPTRMLFVGATACNLNMILSGDTTPVLFTGVSGTLSVRAKDIEATTTTCTTIVGLW